ncbi:MAG TPA: PLP-dependent aminotransferase family protein [Rhodopila sp.]|uniref:MocR-like pyridoxine biosynthesis transcription factor PdxR n=1 Tax=Rhodopila sp. TaxID=2480087 RepID=UPI002C18228C|nr:PLP-dependent aminotransferase family protein [Rhodopila sp.]HVY16464.1 PLP-dependent aminotransferase family protein [Rhodopila sp.]
MALTLTVEKTAGTDLFQQIADAIRSAIARGQVCAGQRLPSARVLAQQLDVARGTVDAAYAMLASEGAVISRRGGGTVVLGKTGAPRVPAASTPFMFACTSAQLPPPIPLRPRLPALDAFPAPLWNRLLADAARDLAPADRADPDPAGVGVLRAAIAGWLTTQRGVPCSAGSVIVTAGFQGALTLARGVLLARGDPVWIEDPGHPPVRQALEAAGARVVPVRMDGDGLRVASGIAAAPKAKLVVVNPAHHYPTGVALSLPRRLELLTWASETGAWVLEDDSDGVFRLAGRALPTLYSLDRDRRVIHAGSFSQTMFPALRLGYVVVPDELGEAFQRAARLLTLGQPALEQRALANFIARGHFARHVKRMRRLYAERRGAMIAALRDQFGEACVPDLPQDVRRGVSQGIPQNIPQAIPQGLSQGLPQGLSQGGLHLIARFPDAPDDTVLAKRAAAAGLAPVALSSLAAAHGQGQGLLLAYSNIPADQADDIVSKLKQVIDAA